MYFQKVILHAISVNLEEKKIVVLLPKGEFLAEQAGHGCCKELVETG